MGDQRTQAIVLLLHNPMDVCKVLEKMELLPDEKTPVST